MKRYYSLRDLSSSGRLIDRKKYRQTERQTGRQKDRPAGRQTDRQNWRVRWTDIII